MIDKKKLKEEYKNLVHPKGIFIIKNEKTGKVFLGSSMNLHGILEKNRLMLNMGSHFITPLQSDWKEHGENSFTLEIVETLELKDDPNYDYNDDLELLEMIWIEKYRPFDKNCYNKNEKIRTV